MNRLDDIEQRLAQLESAVNAKPSIKFFGGWNESMPYPAGAIVQAKGSMYVAEADIPPGVMPHDAEQDESVRSPWKLCVRRGRSGKDGRIPPDIERRLRALEQRL